ncbi:MAG: hypothetical protein WCX97_00150 [Candidatus Magasanikbacteria bacterium]
MPTYFQMPNAWETAKTIWPVFWGISKMLWPLWLFIAIMIPVKIFMRKAIRWADNKRLMKVKKKCSDCAQLVPKEAKKCSYCGKTF